MPPTQAEIDLEVAEGYRALEELEAEGYTPAQIRELWAAMAGIPASELPQSCGAE